MKNLMNALNAKNVMKSLLFRMHNGKQNSRYKRGITGKEVKIMKYTSYIVTLTNGTINHQYNITAMSERQAIILAQAEAIKAARGFDLVNIITAY
jgi:glycyl-tRNA synthetase beta subunit